MTSTKPNTRNNALPIYPAFCFKSSPTNFTWVKIGIADVHRLERRFEFGDHGLFFYKNHPIRFVNVLGLILSRVDVPRRTIITLDDSTGATIDVVILKRDNSSVHFPASKTTTLDDENGSKEPETHQSSTTSTPLSITPLVPGKMVQIKGTLSVFRSTTQIHLERFFSVADTNAEMQFLEARDRFFVKILSVPWYLDDDEFDNLRKGADEEGRRIEEEQCRVQGRGRRKAEREERDRRRIEKRWEREEKIREKETGVARVVGGEFMRVVKMKRAGVNGVV
ncbi:hypothetical protein BDV12DRAFT_195707 [Aspergillus spectabilis]